MDPRHDKRAPLATHGATQDNSVLFSLANLARVAHASSPREASASGATSRTSARAATRSPVDDVITVAAPTPPLLALPVLAPPADLAHARLAAPPDPPRHRTLALSLVAAATILTAGAVTAAAILRPARGTHARTHVAAPEAPRALAHTTDTSTLPPRTPVAPEPPRVDHASGANDSSAASPALTTNVRAALTEPPAPPDARPTHAAHTTQDPHDARPTHGPGARDLGASARDAHSTTTTTTTAITTTTTTTATAPRASECVAHCRGDATCLMLCSVQPRTTAPVETPSVRGAHEPVASGVVVPERPSRDAVLAAMTSARGDVGRCLATRPGALTVHATFASSGRPTQVTVGGAYAGTTEGSCAARAVQRSVRLPAFSQPTFSVDFPYTAR